MSTFLHGGIICLPSIGGGNVSPDGSSAYAAQYLRATLVATQKAEAPLQSVEPVQDMTSGRDADAKSVVVVENTPRLGEKEAEISPPPVLGKGEGVLPVSGVIYYPTNQLTKPPQMVQMAELEAPEMRAFKVSGRLVLKLWIDPEGRVVDAVVEDSELPKIFSETAVKAFMQSRFTPGELSGVRVGSLMRIEVGYEDKSLPVKPVPSLAEH